MTFQAKTNPFADESKPGCDMLLFPFVHAPNAQSASARLACLLRNCADPIIKAQTRGEREDDAAEIHAETVFRLVRRLDGGAHPPIADFCSYVKTTTLNVCRDMGRKSSREKPLSSLERREHYGDVPSDTCIDVEGAGHRIADATNIAHSTALRQHLGVLWSEMLLLPQRQRLALLLHFRDRSGNSALRYWLLCEKSSTDIAGALGITEAALPALMEQLPLGDNAIGQRMGLTRAEVCTLRVTARKRLERRTRLWF